MKPRNIGRALGIGVRVAGRIAGQRIAGSTPAAGSAPQREVPRTVAPVVASNRAAGQTAGQTATQAGRAFSQGLGGFLRPFRRVGGILWLEVTGVFFLLPVVVFIPTLWRASVAYAHTSDHRTFWATVVIVPVFLYLGISSFWRARRR
jgi:hypothetical protein